MINPYKPSVLIVGHRQTVQNQIRRRMFSTVCLPKLLLKFKINMKNTALQLEMDSIDKDGEIYLSKMG